VNLRPELTRPPKRIKRLAVHRGYPVPWFVAWVDVDSLPTRRRAPGSTPDFRVIAPGAITIAHREQLCWICGVAHGRRAPLAFVVGPMCAINRVSSEPPSHVECAVWAAINCPFLSRPHARRREAGVPEGAIEPAGFGIKRNPGCALVWITRSYRQRAAPGGVLFDMGDAERVEWYSEGRTATREEVLASIDSGLPILHDMAARQGVDALAQLDRQTAEARELLPA
jgi:hypothetical protein